MTTATKPRIGYAFTVQGQYWATTDKGSKALRHYRNEVFVLPEIVSFKEGRKRVKRKDADGNFIETHETTPIVKRMHALRCFKHVIRRYHLEPRLKEKYEDYVGVRVMEVVKRDLVDISPEEAMDVSKKAIADMTESDLLQFCAINDLNTQLNIYASVADMRIAVENEWRQNRKQMEARRRVDSPDNDALTAPTNLYVGRSTLSEALGNTDLLPPVLGEEDAASPLLDEGYDDSEGVQDPGFEGATDVGEVDEGDLASNIMQ